MEWVTIKKLLFIFNPNTGGGRLKNKLMGIIQAFSKAGYCVTVFPTAGPGHARQEVIRHGGSTNLLVCCGGDGTLNEVVDGMMHLKTPPLLGYIPGGTTNDFAASLKLPRANMMNAAMRIIAPKDIVSIDVGAFNHRHFTYVAAFGAFTDVAYSTPQYYKNLLGYMAYIMEGLSRLPNIRPFKVKVTTETEEFEEDILFGMVANSASVGGISFPEQSKVQMDDGLFEVLLVRRPHSLAEIGSISTALMIKNFHSPYLRVTRVSKITICTNEPVAWTLDGEFGGELERAEIVVKQKALRICI